MLRFRPSSATTAVTESQKKIEVTGEVSSPQGNSSGGHPGAQPSAPSIRTARWLLLVYWPTLAIGTHLPGLPSLEVEGIFLKPDKLIHFGSYVLLTLLFFRSTLVGPGGPFRTNLRVTVLVVTAYMCLDEFTQPWTGRTFDTGDLIANFLGICTAYGALAISPVRPAPAPARTFIGHAVTVGALTFGSRLLGVARAGVFAAFFGMTPITDAFMAGFLVPNLFRRLFGEGALTAAFVPIYTRLIHQDRVTAQRLACLCVGLILVGLGLVTLLGELILSELLDARAWSDRTALALELTMIMLPYMPMICLVALLGALLQVHGRFGPPAVAPIILNLVLIGGTWFAAHGVRGQAGLEQSIRIVAMCVLVAGVFQLIWQVTAVIRYENVTLNFAGTRDALSAIGAMMLPMVVGLAVFQINTLMDILIGLGLSSADASEKLNLGLAMVDYPMRTGAVTALGFAQRLYQFPLGVFGIALATAIFPALVHAAAGSGDDGSRFGQTLKQGLRLAAFIGLPASAGLIMVRLPLTRLVFERGQFSPADTLRVAVILAGYASAVWAFALTHVLTRAFYALKDSRTPLRISLCMVGLNLLLNLSFIWFLGAAGLAWSTAVCGALQVVLLIKALGRHIDRPVDGAVRRSWSNSLRLTAIMTVALGLVMIVWPDRPGSAVASAVRLFALVGTGTAAITVGAYVTKAQELRWLLRRGG